MKEEGDGKKLGEKIQFLTSMVTSLREELRTVTLERDVLRERENRYRHIFSNLDKLTENELTHIVRYLFSFVIIIIIIMFSF